MKLKKTCLAAVAAITLTGPASATVILTDNFNTAQDGSNINNQPGLSNDQGGTLDPITSSISHPVDPNRSWAVRRGFSDGGNYVSEMAVIGNGTAYSDPVTWNAYSSLNYNFATISNSNDSILELEFNVKAFASSAVDGSDWGSIQFGSAQNAFVTNPGNTLGLLFRDNGAISNVGGTTASSARFTDGNLIKLMLSNSAGTGSAFNSDGSTDVVKLFVNGSLAATYTGLNFTATDGYITFAAHNANLAVDNLKISTIPETSTTLLGGLGALALLRRRRK
jgi:hypothetical protein